MGASEKPATPCEKASEADAASRYAPGSKESGKADQESREACRKDRETLRPEQERERLARWLRAGEMWLPQKLKNTGSEEA